MKIVIALMLAIAATFALSSAIVAGAPERPPGVSADEWAAISDSVGVVLVQHKQPTTSVVIDRNVLLLAPPAEGYFVVKRGRQWRRLVVVEPIKGPGESG
jgi:hypothetical protein